MYLPRHFAETRVEELHRIITEYPLGTLVVNGPDGLDANHLPFELDPDAGGRGRLFAHVARANAVWKEVRDGDEGLVIFRAPDAYISPNWYPSKHEFHRQVPTWNYQAVHVHGRISVRDDARFVRGVVARLTRVHEKRTDPSGRPWKMTDSSKEFVDQMLKAIVGIQIDVETMIGKSKLSQNKEVRDRINAAEALEKRGEQAISGAMRRTVEDTG
ncbi:MAG: FMN-binding negative transcriptional regulator [Ectothiorhodospiraceae bacterium]|nr:FMN-binding negative transcriptional regulator [Ectothiorhodospiraceae bacterium]